jgi:hypothetical protein
MGLWEKVQKELDRAGNAAKGALDEGKIRIELFRVRQQADKAAQALGYALHRAKRDGRELEAEALERLYATLAGHESEAKKLEEELAAVLAKDAAPGAKPADEAAAAPPPPPNAEG